MQKKWEYSSTGTIQAGNGPHSSVAKDKDSMMERKPLEVSIIIVTLALRNLILSNIKNKINQLQNRAYA